MPDAYKVIINKKLIISAWKSNNQVQIGTSADTSLNSYLQTHTHLNGNNLPRSFLCFSLPNSICYDYTSFSQELCFSYFSIHAFHKGNNILAQWEMTEWNKEPFKLKSEEKVGFTVSKHESSLMQKIYTLTIYIMKYNR